jgi:hypothetical protein
VNVWSLVERIGRVTRSLPGGPEIATTIGAGNHAVGGMNTSHRWRIMGLQKRTGKTGFASASWSFQLDQDIPRLGAGGGAQIRGGGVLDGRETDRASKHQ